MTTLFYLAGAVAVVATFLVITRSRAVHALLYLVVSLLAVAVVFFTLGAPFAAALEVIIYAGAIMVLFVFALMILGLGPEAGRREAQWLSPLAWGGPAGSPLFSWAASARSSSAAAPRRWLRWRSVPGLWASPSSAPTSSASSWPR